MSHGGRADEADPFVYRRLAVQVVEQPGASAQKQGNLIPDGRDADFPLRRHDEY
jgi:hypothetical protein